MLPRKLTSLQHPVVKHLVKLRENRSYRHTCKTALIPGKKLAIELAKHFPLKTLISLEKIAIPAQEKFLATEEIIKKITGLENPEGIAIEIPIPLPTNLENKNFLIAFDQIQDPGNLGTLLRTAWAFGVQGIFYLEGTVDPFNEKVIRSAKGANFFLPYFMGTLADLKKLCIRKNIYLGDVKGTPLTHITFKSPLILILGNEGKGAQNAIKEMAISISIPMIENVNSLNVATAGAILLYMVKNAL